MIRRVRSGLDDWSSPLSLKRLSGRDLMIQVLVEGSVSARRPGWAALVDKGCAVSADFAISAVNDSALYFWSDQHGVKIQMLGHSAPGDDMDVVSGSLDARRFVAAFSVTGS